MVCQICRRKARFRLPPVSSHSAIEQVCLLLQKEVPRLLVLASQQDETAVLKPAKYNGQSCLSVLFFPLLLPIATGAQPRHPKPTKRFCLTALTCPFTISLPNRIFSAPRRRTVTRALWRKINHTQPPSQPPTPPRPLPSRPLLSTAVGLRIRRTKTL